MQSENGSEIRIAVAQFSPHTDKPANLADLRGMVASAAAAGARVLVAPEYAMFATARLDQRMIEAAESLDGPFVTAVREMAKEHGMHIVAGMAERRSDDALIHNTVIVAADDGSLACRYRKLHLFDAFGFVESELVVPGDPIDDPTLFTVDGIVFGLQTCYDVRFPESVRRASAAGAHVLLLPAQWVPGPLKVDHWTTLVRARAIENTMYVAAADHSAPRGAGHSMIVDPAGVVLAGIEEGSGTATATVSLDRLRAVRTQNPCLDLRRL